jgi:histone H3/H4
MATTVPVKQKKKSAAGKAPKAQKTAKAKAVKLPKPQGAVEGESSQKKKRKHARHADGYEIYIHRLVKHHEPQMGVSRRAMKIFDQLAANIFENISRTAGTICHASRPARVTLSQNEINTAARLIFPPEIAKLATYASQQAIDKFKTSVAQ